MSTLPIPSILTGQPLRILLQIALQSSTDGEGDAKALMAYCYCSQPCCLPPTSPVTNPCPRWSFLSPPFPPLGLLLVLVISLDPPLCSLSSSPGRQSDYQTLGLMTVPTVPGSDGQLRLPRAPDQYIQNQIDVPTWVSHGPSHSAVWDSHLLCSSPGLPHFL